MPIPPAIVELGQQVEYKITQLSMLCKELHQKLFFAESYYPKTIPIDASSEVEFWYWISNIYNLFFDCSKYMFGTFGRGGFFVFDRGASGSLLSEMKNRGLLTYGEQQEIIYFTDAIKELRSCFCHNKPPDSFLPQNLKHRYLDNLSHPWSKWSTNHWRVLHHLGPTNATFDYTQTLTTILYSVNTVLDRYVKIVQTLAQMAPADKQALIEAWMNAVVYWYLATETIVRRAFNEYLLLKRNQLHARSRNINDLRRILVMSDSSYCTRTFVPYCRKNCFTLSVASHATPLEVLIPLFDSCFLNSPLPQL